MINYSRHLRILSGFLTRLAPNPHFLILIGLSFSIFACDKQVTDFVNGAKSGAVLPGSGTSTSPISNPTIQWTSSSTSTNKSAAATLNFTVQLSSVSTKTVVIPLSISGTAILNSDYSTPAAGSVSIPAGQTSVTMSVTIINDGIAGSNKSVILTLGTPTNAMLGNTSVHTVTIVNDIAVNLSIAATSIVTEGTSAVFAVTLSAVSASTVTVQYATSNGTALAGTNYTLTSGTLTFNPGVTSQNITVPTLDAGVYFPGGKNFSVTLSSAFNAGLGTSVGTGTINSNHLQPTVQWTLATQSTNKSAAATLTVTAQLSNVSSQNVTLPFVLGGTAVLNTDYSISPASPLTIAAGATSAAISVTIINNSVAGSNSTISLTEGAPTNASLGATTLHTITINNDLLGNFNITGITGPSDAVLDAFLNGGVNPTINWGASTSATSYDVSIYQSDGTTVQCALINTVSTSYAFSACTLTAGQIYKAKVIAKGPGPSQAASNSLFSLFVNSPPTAATIATRFVMMNSSVSTDVLTGASCAFAGCTLSIASSANTAAGTTSFLGNNITYAPNASYTGTDSFTYTIADGRGGTATGTINIKVMTAFTWTGGGANTSWASVNNWCGTLNAGKSACLGGAQPSTADTAIFDGTCGSNCSANINSNIDIAALKMNAGYTGTITQNPTYTIILETAAGFSQAAGTFVGGNSAVIMYGNFILSGGSYTATSGTWSFGGTGGTFSITGSPVFNAQAGSLEFAQNSGVTNITPGTVTYNNVKFIGTLNSFSLGGGTMTITGNLTEGDSFMGGSSINSGTLNVAGNITAIGNGYLGSALIVATGNAGGQTISGTGGAMPGLTLAAGANPVTFSGSFQIRTNYIVTSVGAFSATGSTVIFGCNSQTCTITPSNLAYNNISFNGYAGSFNLGGATMTINGNLTEGDTYGGGYQINSGTLNVKGDLTANYAGYQGSALINIVGNPAGQTISGIPNATISHLTIAAGANPVTLSGTLQLLQNYTLTSVGTFTSTGSTLVLVCNGTCTFNPGTVAYNNVSFIGSSGIYNMGGVTMTINGNLTQGDAYGNGFQINSATLNVKGDLIATYSGYQGSALINLVGNPAGQTIYGNGTYITNLTIAAGTNPVTLNGTIQLLGTYNLTSVGTFTSTGSTLVFGCYGTCTFNPGTVAYNNVSFIGNTATYNLGGVTMTINGNLTEGDTYGGGYQINSATLNVKGNIDIVYAGYAGNFVLNLVGTGARTLSTWPGCSAPTGNININITGGAGVTLGSAIAFNSAGQTLSITSGSINMAGFNLTLNALTLSAGTSISRNTGVLTVNGSAVGAGAYSSGTIAN